MNLRVKINTHAYICMYATTIMKEKESSILNSCSQPVGHDALEGQTTLSQQPHVRHPADQIFTL